MYCTDQNLIIKNKYTYTNMVFKKKLFSKQQKSNPNMVSFCTKYPDEKKFKQIQMDHVWGHNPLRNL